MRKLILALFSISFLAFDINIESIMRLINDIDINANIKPLIETIKPGNCTTPIEIDPDEAYNFIIEKNPIIIDVRTKQEFIAERLPNVSYNIDFYSPDFKEQLNKLDKSGKYLIYCRTGRRSSATLEIMKELGFKDIHHIKGGIVAWKEKGYPTVKGENAIKK